MSNPVLPHGKKAPLYEVLVKEKQLAPTGIKEENINEASQVEIASSADEPVVKTVSSLNRTVEPAAGQEPEVKVPEIWKAELSNGIRVFGIQNKELPLVNVTLVISGGVSQDKMELPGVANLVANVLPLGTKNKTPEELEEENKPLALNWKPKKVIFNNYPVPSAPEKSTIYFIDIPGSRQSVIYIGYPALTRDNPDFVKADFINYRLGGAFTSILNQILREDKGFTYGASSYFQRMKTIAPFVASTSVRSDATLESLKIFKSEMKKYREGIDEEDLQFIKNCMIRSNALGFETNGDLVSMLSNIATYGFPDDYIKKEEDVIRKMTIDDHRAITCKYIVPEKMYWVVVGDAATQLKPLEEIGFGKPVLLEKKQEF